jgi:hypothetical protein
MFFFSEANSAFLGYFFGEIFETFSKEIQCERVAAHFQISQHCQKFD